MTPDLTVMFWNLNNQDHAAVWDLLADHNAFAVLYLAECPRSNSVLRALNPPGVQSRYCYHRPEHAVSTRSLATRHTKTFSVAS